MNTLPIIPGPITIDPADPEVITILSTLCFRAGPVASIFRKAGYPIPTHAEEEQAHVIAWQLAIYQKHGAYWRVKANEELKEILNAAAPQESTPSA